MKILRISGSIRKGSKNQALLDYLPKLSQEHTFESFSLEEIPLFYPDFEAIPKAVEVFKTVVLKADALIISTPEYLHNIPAILKNALEWLTQSGELDKKRIVAIVYTPHEPRGQKAMQSLLNTLLALKANVLTTLELYHTDIAFDEEGKLIHQTNLSLVQEMLNLLKS